MKRKFAILLIVLPYVLEAQDLTKNNNQMNKVITSNNTELVCLLTSEELVERKEDLRKKVFSKVLKTEEASDGFVFYFESNEKLLADLFNYILAEKKCCPFFRQEVLIESDDLGIKWKVSGPNGVKDILRQIMEDG